MSNQESFMNLMVNCRCYMLTLTNVVSFNIPNKIFYQKNPISDLFQNKDKFIKRYHSDIML